MFYQGRWLLAFCKLLLDNCFSIVLRVYLVRHELASKSYTTVAALEGWIIVVDPAFKYYDQHHIAPFSNLQVTGTYRSFCPELNISTGLEETK